MSVTTDEQAGIYRSSDDGVTFALVVNTQGLFVFNVYLSASGQYQLATNSSGLPYRSSDYGLTFTQIAVGPSPGNLRIDGAVSASGQYQTLCVIGGQLWRSSDYGVTFTAVASAPTQPWQTVSVSASGQYQVATGYLLGTGALYSSVDYGVTWAPLTTALFSGNWNNLAISASGQYIITANYSSGSVGYIWTCANPLFVPSLQTTTLTVGSTIGINCNSPQYALDVNGLPHQSNNTTLWTVASDRRIKTDIVNADSAMCMSSLKALPLRYYQYDSNLFPERTDKHVIGCVAQEVQLVFPKAVTVTSNYGISDLMGLDYDQIYKANIGATKHLGEVIETQSTQIAALLAQASTMNESLSYIPQLVSTLKGLGH